VYQLQEQQQEEEQQQDAENPFLDPPLSRIKICLRKYIEKVIENPPSQRFLDMSLGCW
jgi:hypothetical protein